MPTHIDNPGYACVHGKATVPEAAHLVLLSTAPEYPAKGICRLAVGAGSGRNLHPLLLPRAFQTATLPSRPSPGHLHSTSRYAGKLNDHCHCRRPAGRKGTAVS
jgi:hypothetical protein